MAHILYFAYLPDKLGRAQEELKLPDSVPDVRALLALLRARGGVWEQVLTEDRVRVLANKQFAAPESAITDGDEIAIISSSPF
jgi:molybdopterin converting factor small subunit